MYPVGFFDALCVKMREAGVVRSKAVYLVLGVLTDGSRDILGGWVENTEGARFWMTVFNNMKTCIVHLIRNSLDFASWKGRKALGPQVHAARSGR